MVKPPVPDEHPEQINDEDEAVASNEPVLDLSTLAPERQTVRIRTEEHPDGALYELQTIEDVNIEDQQFLYSHGQILDKLMNKATLTKSERQKLNMVLDKMTAIVLDTPDKVRAQLSDWQKSQVVNAFIMASPSLREAAQEFMATLNQ